jgi:hypothetical protein
MWRILMAKSDVRCKWHGDKQDGVELRYKGDLLDEILLYVGGRCVLHVEQIDDVCWLGMYAVGHTVHANALSSIGTTISLMADGWEEDNTAGGFENGCKE